MAKKQKKNNYTNSIINEQASQISNDPSVNPQDIIANSLMDLDEEWAAQFVMWAYGTTPANIIAANSLAYYRGIDLGVFDTDQLKRFFEPSDKISNAERANLVRTDWRPCPLIHSLNMVVQKNIESIPLELVVRGSDKLSLDKKAKQKLKIKNRRYFLDIVNFMSKSLGDEQIDDSLTIDQVVAGNQGNTDESLSLMDSIKNEATDDWDFNALNEIGALKDEVEIAHEQMTSYYFRQSRFQENIAPKLVSDFMKINFLSYRFYTSAVNGLPMVQYIDPAFLMTSNFYHRNGDDMDWWYYTETVTWETYMHMVGGKQSPEKNKLIYEYNRDTWYNNNPNYPAFPINYTGYNSFSTALLNTYIRIGYFEARKHVYDESTDTYYDVIRKFYYLPFGIGSQLTSEYILDLGNLQDAYRHGFNLQNVDFSLIVYRDFQRQSFYDAQQGDFLRLNVLYNQYLNTLSNFIPEGVAFAEETIRELAENIQAEEEELMKQQGQDISTSLQKITQDVVRNYVLSGRGVFKLRAGDNDEQRLDRPTFIMENKILFDLEGLVKQIFSVYNGLLMSLGISQSRLGQDPKQHQTLTGIEMANTASYFSTQSIEESFIYSVKNFGARMIYYDQQVITEFDKNGEPTTDRAKQMKAILGEKGVIPLEVFNEMPEQNCLFYVVNAPTQQDRLQLMSITANYEAQGLVPAGTLLIAQEIQNYKLAKIYVIFAMKRQQRIQAENAERAMAMQQQQQQQSFMISQQVQQQNRNQDAEIQARLTALESQLKTQGQLAVKDKTNQNRLQENQQKADLKLQTEQARKQMESY